MSSAIAPRSYKELGIGLFALTCISTLMLVEAADCQEFTLRDGASVVFYGDSITAQRLYTRFAEDFVLTRYPQLHVLFANAGVPGDTVFGGYAGAMLDRTRRDVQPFRPTMITVLLGMNDGGYGYTATPAVHANFINGYAALLGSLQEVAPEATLTLMNPTPYDEVTHGTEFAGYSVLMDRIPTMWPRLQRRNTPVAHLCYWPIRIHLWSMRLWLPQNSFLNSRRSSFRIAFTRQRPPIGSWRPLLKAWHVDPAVTNVVLDVKQGRVADAQRTSVTILAKAGTGVRWQQLDEALPLPLDLNNAMTPVMLAISNVAQLDQEILRVDGLDSGMYELLVDAKVVATFSDGELRGGVNLAFLKTPMWEQARGIDFLEERRGMLEQARFILAEELKPKETSAAADARLRDGQKELAETVRTRLTLKPHIFELLRQQRP